MIEIISDHKPTNADRIRSMTDEELAKFIEAVGCLSHYTSMTCGHFICQSMNGNLCNGLKNSEPDKRILEWLQRLAE